MQDSPLDEMLKANLLSGDRLSHLIDWRQVALELIKEIAAKRRDK